ncbi:MAG: PD-(D/E)XK nuclease family protein [Chlamydiia bacterium]|nr:PD-(D/E)XK nuclease family protein [Chlamydiia bacterium]
MGNTCTIPVTPTDIKIDLIAEHAVDDHMNILDENAVKQFQEKLQKELKSKYPGIGPLIYVEGGKVTVDEENLIDLFQVVNGTTKEALEAKPKAARIHSNAMINEAVERIRSLMPNTDVKILSELEIANLYGEDAAKERGFFTPNNGIVLNRKHFELDTPFHEYGHLAMKFLREHFNDEYMLIVTKALQHPDAAQVKKDNPELDDEALGEEIFVSKVGIKAAHNFTQSKGVYAGIKNFYKRMVNTVFGIDEDNISSRDSFETIISKFSDRMLNPASVFHMMNSSNASKILSDAGKAYDQDAMYDQLFYDGYIRKVGKNDVFLDVNNKHSKVYYDAVDNGMSKEDAKDIYLRYMSNFVNLKFQRLTAAEKIKLEDAVAQLDREHGSLKIKDDASGYETTDGSGEEFQRTTSFKNRFIDEFNGEQVALELVMKEKKKEFKEQALAGDTTNDSAGIKEQRAQAVAERKFAAMSDSDVNILVQEKLKVFEFKRDEGTFIHQLAEDFIDARQRLRDAREKDPKATIMIRDYSMDKVRGVEVAVYDESILAGLIAGKPRISYSDGVDAQGNKIVLKDDTKDNHRYSPATNATIKEHRATYLRNLTAQLNKFEEGKGKIKYKTEVRLRGKFGFAGSIDLLAIDMDDNKAYVIDHKTKEQGKEFWWDHRNEKFSGKHFKKFYHNAKMDASLQTSMYRLMLEEKGFKTGDSVVFYTEGEIDLDSGPMQYKNIQVKTKILENLKEEIIETFNDDGIAIQSNDRKNRNDIHETMSQIADGQDIDFFDPPQEYIDKLYKTTTTVNGKEGFYWENRFITYRNDAVSIAQKKEAIRSRLSIRDSLNQIEEDMQSLYHDPNYTMRDEKEKRNILSNLRGITSATHTMRRLSRENAFGPNYTGIVIFTNIMTGESRVIQLLASANQGDLRFGDSEHTTIFGKYRSNSAVKSSLFAHDKYKSDNMLSMKIAKVGLVIAKLRMLDSNFKVDYIQSTQPLKYLKEQNSDTKGIMYDLHSVMRITSTLLKDAKAAGDVVGSVEEILKDPEALLGESYEATLPVQLLHALEENSGPFRNLSTITEELELYMADSSRPIHELVIQLNDFVSKNALPDDIKRTVLRTILHLKGFRTSAITQDIETLEKYLTIPAHSSNFYVQKMGDVARGNKRAARVNFIEYSIDHSKVTTDLLGDRTYANVLSMGTPEEMKALMLPYDASKPDQMYRFKPDAALNTAQLAYKKFFQRKLKEAFEMAALGTKKKQEIEAYIEKGYIPLISSSFREKLIQSTNEDREKIGLDKFHQAGNNSEEASEAKYDLEFRFQDELGVDDMQGSSGRRRKLGIDSEGGVEKIRTFETNLEVILDAVYSEALMTKYGRNTLAVGRALALEMKYQFDMFDHETKGLKEVLELVSHVFVKGEMSNTLADRVLGSASTLATFTAIALSAKSMVLETVTNLANVTKLFIQEDLMSKLLNAESKFSAKHMMKATKLMATDAEKSNLLMLYFGMKESDPRRLGRFISATQKGRLFKSDNFFFVQGAVLSLAQMEILLAIMLKHGSYDAYSVKDGKLVYNEKKDARFFPQDGGVRTKEQIAIHEHHKKILGQEGKIDKDGKMILGYSDMELNSIKNYTVEAFSSMDDDSRNASTYSLFGRMVGKFKTWVLPRVARIVGTPSEERLSLLRWNYLKDENGNIIKVIPQFDPAEGYLYTIGKLLNAAYVDKSIEGMKDLTEGQKQKLKEAGADFTMVGLLLLAFSAVTCSAESKADGSCWHRNSALGHIAYQSLRDAPSDILVPITIWQTLTGNSSMAPSLSIAERLAKRTITGTVMMVEEDPAKGFRYITDTITSAKYFAQFVDDATSDMNKNLNL